MSATIGVAAEMRSKSSIVKSMPNSRAMATRWRTPFVEPPVPAIAAAAFSTASFVTIVDGRRSFRTTSTASLPISYAASAFAPFTAGIPFAPSGVRPRKSTIVDIVFAVNWPPHAPAAGQATDSSSCSSSALIFPAAYAPIAS